MLARMLGKALGCPQGEAGLEGSRKVRERRHVWCAGAPGPLRRFKFPRQAQRFLSVHGSITNLFRRGRYLMSASHYRLFRVRAFATWQEVTYIQNVA